MTTPELLDRLPTAGGALVLIAIIGILTRLWLASEERHRAEMQRLERAAVERERRLSAEVLSLRIEVRELQADLDKERRARWKAQDAAAVRVRRNSGGQVPGGER